MYDFPQQMFCKLNGDRFLFKKDFHYVDNFNVILAIKKNMTWHDIYNFIYMNIHMEKTFKAMQCQKCRKYVRKKGE